MLNILMEMTKIICVSDLTVVCEKKIQSSSDVMF